MLEHRRQPLLSTTAFVFRLLRTVLAAFSIVAVSLTLGALGYHHFAELSWVNSVLNSAMILTGMGQVAELHSTSAKLFATAYALFSGLAFLTVSAVFFTPIVHRVLHRLHLEMQEESTELPKV